MDLLFCPGYHDPQLTQNFLQALELPPSVTVHIYPAHRLPPYSAHHILQFLSAQGLNGASKSPLIIIAFSAGVVGAIGAAKTWQRAGGIISSFIALDGWGVPLWADFPIYRLSHDRFTHETSCLLGKGEGNFFADPAVNHLDLLRSPKKIQGWAKFSNIQRSSQQNTALMPAYSLSSAKFLSHEDKKSTVLTYIDIIQFFSMCIVDFSRVDS